ncbi:hypothetical protein [Oryzomicrobium sp.]|uniref:hypothetical protein n=1 Tax=Oryzomicrobium sp. TaxID=1911578 RepID=UPI0025D956E2|nr:hypothetical protein [Oryzomicrobium sp.]MCE1243590.1 hypothetical protein [Oryzomicrobium sp.]
MNTPKILPWVARKAGITDDHATKLWKRAVREAATITGCSEGPAFHKLSVERFLDNVEAAAFGTVRHGYSNTPARLSWFWRHQGRMAIFGLMAAENAARFWQNTWNDTVTGMLVQKRSNGR